MLTAIIFLIVLAVLIFVHELGHFLFAKMFGIRVDAFKIGFGPKIFAWRPTKKDGTRGETEYGLNLIPFGGYVKIFGENGTDDTKTIPASSPTYVESESLRNFAHKPRWQQVIVLFGGVLFNFLFAAIIYIGLFSHGVTATADGFPKYTQYFHNERIMVTDVVHGSPADKAGLQIGDVLVSIVDYYADAGEGHPTEFVLKNSSAVYGSDTSSVQNIINAGGASIARAKKNNNAGDLVLGGTSDQFTPMSINYQRSGKIITISIVPATSTVSDKYLIGITMNDVADMKLPFFTAVYEGAHYAVDTFCQTVAGLYGFVAQIFHGNAKLSDISGPVGIAGIVGDAARLGMTYLLMITALISINLSVINLLPFPALDGGRILFVAIEAVIRRRISQNFTNWTNGIGFVVLMLLMVVVTFKDIVKLFK